MQEKENKRLLFTQNFSIICSWSQGIITLEELDFYVYVNSLCVFYCLYCPWYQQFQISFHHIHLYMDDTCRFIFLSREKKLNEKYIQFK